MLLPLGVPPQERLRVSWIPAFERDPWLTRLDTEVVSGGEVEGRPFVVLADTILYPEGGGQPADSGTVAGVAVVDVQKSADGIRHVLERPVAPGPVTVELDFRRRFDHMQHHTAQHLLTALAERLFGWRTLAFHLGAHVSDIELDTPTAGPEELSALEEALAEEIRAARPVTTRRVDAAELAGLPVRSRGLPEGHSGSIRLVEIDGIDLNTCGGTHCSSTAELEALKLLGTESMRGGTRLFFAAGARLRRLHEAHHRRTAELRALLGASDDELVARVSTRLDQLKVAERSIRALKAELASASAAALLGQDGPVLTGHWPERDLPFLQAVARAVATLAEDRVVFLTCGEADAGAFVVGAGPGTDLDLPEAGRRVADLLGGRGGGASGIFQGKATRLDRRDEAAELLRSLP
jgi:alanyl-tRNA synthetase